MSIENIERFILDCRHELKRLQARDDDGNIEYHETENVWMAIDKLSEMVDQLTDVVVDLNKKVVSMEATIKATKNE